MRSLLALICFWGILSVAQEPPKKANSRTTATATETTDPFDGASVEKMAAECVTLETQLGAIDIAMLPENAPEEIGRAHV